MFNVSIRLPKRVLFVTIVTIQTLERRLLLGLVLK